MFPWYFPIMSLQSFTFLQLVIDLLKYPQPSLTITRALIVFFNYSNEYSLSFIRLFTKVSFVRFTIFLAIFSHNCKQCYLDYFQCLDHHYSCYNQFKVLKHIQKQHKLWMVLLINFKKFWNSSYAPSPGSKTDFAWLIAK